MAAPRVPRARPVPDVWWRLPLELAAVLVALTSFAIAEDIGVTGYFPSPRGVYQSLQTMSATNLAINGGTRMDVGPPTGWGQKVNVNGRVRAVDFDGYGAIPLGSGLVMMFQGACPAPWAPVGGGWNGRILRGGPGFGATGGADTHTHRLDHVHALAPQAGNSSTDGSHTHDGMDISHPHGYAGNSSGGDSWVCCDQGCGMFEQCRQAAVAGHSHGLGGVTDPVFMTVDSDAGGDHSHTLTVTWTSVVEAAGTDAVSNWPSYIEVVFCRAP